MVLHRSHKDYHPERPERILSLYFRLAEVGLLESLTKIEVQEVSEENLLMVHQ